MVFTRVFSLSREVEAIMRIAGIGGFSIFAMLVALFTLLPVTGHAQNADVRDVIVLFRDGVDPVQRERVLRDAGAHAEHHFSQVPASTATANANSRAFLAQHPDVIAVVPDRSVHKLGKPTGGGNTSASPQVIPAGVQ